MTQKKNTKRVENINDMVKAYREEVGLKRHDLSNGRWYESKGKYYISVTSFDSIVTKGENFDNWLMTNGFDAIKIRDEKALIGTIVHAYIDMLVEGEDIDLRQGFNYNGTHYNFGLSSNEE